MKIFTIPPRPVRAILGIAVILALGIVIGRLTGTGRGNTGHGHTDAVPAAGEEATVWTCSMHPQIKLPHPGKCPICFMDLIPLEKGTSDAEGPRDLRVSEAAKKLAEIVTVPAERREVFHEVRTVGFVTYDETRVRSITTRVPGRLDRLFVDFTGVEVRKGEKLFTIYSPELYAAQEEFLQALKSGNRVLEKAAREKLALWDLTPDQIGEIESRGSAAPHTTIVSPQAGVVISKNGQEGMYVSTGMNVYTVADLAVVWVEMDAYETDLPWMRLGQNVTFTTRAAPGKTFTGRISFINPVLDTKTRTVKVRVTIVNRDRLLKPGMFVSGIIASRVGQKGNVVTGNVKKQPLVVPASAPLITGKRALVYVALKNADKPTYQGREVVLGPRAGDYYVVVSGLDEGDEVVAHGAFKIDAALQIQAKPSMMQPGTDGKDQPAFTAPAGFLESLNGLYRGYLAAQQALAADDLEAARRNLASLPKALEKVKRTVLAGSARKSWQTHADDLQRALQHIHHVGSLTGVREIFRDVSGVMIDVEHEFGHGGDGNHYVAFCPMAFDNKGGSWIQTQKDINNPYYGSAMLNCGEIKKTIQGD